MRTRYRDVSAKYRSFRLQPDAMFHSRIINTLFNKFIKKGKKAKSRRHIFRALRYFRFTLRRPRTYNAIIRMLRELRLNFILVSRRQGKKFLDVPVPVRRNKRDVINIQTLTNAIRRRRERQLDERWAHELLALSVHRSASTTLRQRSAYLAKIYEERVWMDKRWK